MRDLRARAAESVKMSLVPEILLGGELDVDALRLEDDADVAAKLRGIWWRRQSPG